MVDQSDKRWLMVVPATLVALLLVGELHYYLVVKPVALPTLLFALAEVLLLVACTVVGTLMVLRVRAKKMAAAAAAMMVPFPMRREHHKAWEVQAAAAGVEPSSSLAARPG